MDYVSWLQSVSIYTCKLTLLLLHFMLKNVIRMLGRCILEHKSLCGIVYNKRVFNLKIGFRL